MNKSKALDDLFIIKFKSALEVKKSSFLFSKNIIYILVKNKGDMFYSRELNKTLSFSGIPQFSNKHINILVHTFLQALAVLDLRELIEIRYAC